MITGTNSLYALRLILFFMSFSCLLIEGKRSIHRKEDPHMPTIRVSWQGDSKQSILKDYHLDEYPFFKLFDNDYFNEHMLPNTPISFRYEPEKNITKKILTAQIDNFIMEINAGKKKFTDFDILQDKDFNKRKKYGLIIAKFKQYPFVAKVFIETPQSFANPFNKGMEPVFFFFMGNGINRHLSGFTRLKNRDLVQSRIKESPHWASLVDIPRKWFWMPSSSKWMEVTGHQFNGKDEQKILIPGTYIIIADAIKEGRQLSLLNTQDAQLALSLCNYLDLCIDPHLKNFMIELDTQKLVIVDTEHFPSFVGLNEKVTFSNYFSWYGYLAGKCAYNAFGQTKKERRFHKIPPADLRLT